jgi:hypothetical protein
MPMPPPLHNAAARRLAGDPLLSSVTHVVVDEVHERTMQVGTGAAARGGGRLQLC